MEPRERIIRAFSDGDGERPPAAIFTQSATVSQMDRCGAAWPEANYRADLMARLALEPSRSFGFLTVRVPFSITAEAQSLGCEVRDCGKSSQPMVVGSPYRDSGAVPDVPDMPSPEEFAASPLIGLAPEALRLAGKERPGLFSVSGVAGPVSVVGLLLGIENLVMGTMSDMPLIGRWISAVQPLITAEAKLCAEAADCVQITDGLASPDILPLDEFDAVCGDRLRSIYSSLKCCKTLHICGDCTETVGKMARIGADGISIDVQTDTATAVREAKGRTVLIGGVGPVSPLYTGTPKDVKAEALASAEAGYGIIAPGCGVPPSASDENLRALAHYSDA
jgi:[methyl-Co(III) methanol-specific corrinoid protein]:coenzyme M methyltransferase